MNLISWHICGQVFPKSLAAAEQLKAAAWQIVQKGESGVETRDDIKRPAKNYHDRLGAEMKNSSRYPPVQSARLDTGRWVALLLDFI